MKKRQTIITLLTSLLIYGSAVAAETVLSPGDDVAAALRDAQSGDVIALKGGYYSVPISLSGIRGPLTIRAIDGERPVLDGTIPLPISNDWKEGEGGIWSVQLSQDIWQLFDDREMLQTARWPDYFIGDEHFWNQKCSYRKMTSESSFGTVIDERPLSGVNEQGKSQQDEGALSQGRTIPDDVNIQTLADTGVSMQGAIAILNIGSWQTWAQAIDSHVAGSNSFT